MTTRRILLGLLPALLLTLLFAAAPAAGAPCAAVDPAVAAKEGWLPVAGHLPKAADHASKKPRPSATLEEYFEIDDDAEQNFPHQPVLVHERRGVTLAAAAPVPPYCAAFRTHRACAAFATGPPHA